MTKVSIKSMCVDPVKAHTSFFLSTDLLDTARMPPFRLKRDIRIKDIDGHEELIASQCHLYVIIS